MRIIVLCLIVLFPAPCLAEEACLWLNAATAAGNLGGLVSMAVTPTSCDFATSPPAIGHLHVEVVVMKDIAKEFPAWLARCKRPSESLDAIGNQAIACEVDGSQQVVGRVREQAFLVKMRIADRSVTRDSLRQKAKRIAEIVAGNLF
jgi:hypothetical protein